MGRGGGCDFGSGSGSKFNCAARVGSGRVGSGQTISGTGQVRASVLSPCRPLLYIQYIPMWFNPCLSVVVWMYTMFVFVLVSSFFASCGFQCLLL